MKSQTLWFFCIAAVVVGVLFGLGVKTSQEPAATQPAGSAASDSLPFRFMENSEFIPSYDEFGRSVPSSEGENLAPASTGLKSESFEIELALDEGIEYKAVMSQGDSLVYEWQVQEEGGEVYYDFHGHPPDADEDFFTRYGASEGASDQGAIIAAYDGQHGWYWLNISDSAVTIELRVAGFYDEVLALDVY